MKLRQIVVYSQMKEKMVSFLSDLFELDIIPAGDGVVLSGEDLQFLIVHLDKKQNFHESLLLDFECDDLDDLESFWQRVKFHLYRHQFKEENLEAIQSFGKRHGFYFQDGEGRKWKFSAPA